MNYIISKLNKYNVEDYVRVNSLAWKQSYKGIVDKNFLELNFFIVTTYLSFDKLVAHLIRNH